MPSNVLSPPSRYFQTARPGLTQSVCKPAGKSDLSGGGETLLTMSQLTSVLRSAPSHHHAPGRGDRSFDRRRLRQALRFFLAITQIEGMTDRQGMAQDGFESTLAVSLQPHAGVVDQCAFGDRGVAESLGSLMVSGGAAHSPAFTVGEFLS